MRFYQHTPQPDLNQVRAAWRQFVERGNEEPPPVRPHILRAWTRSARAGCNPLLPRADVLAPPDTVALLHQEKPLIDIATPFMIALSRAAAGERHAAMLADGTGRLLKVIGDQETVADENFPRAGSLLSEAAAGANGVGTTLAEGGYVDLVGPEHFIEGFHVYTCQGVPLVGPSNVPIGVLSTSVRRLETATKLRDILFCASESAECELLSSWLSESLLPKGALEAALEALRQDVVQRIAMARLQLELAAKQIAAGADATTTVRAAQQLSQKFRRQAAMWRNLVGDEPSSPEPIALGDLMQGFVELLETEARVASVKLVWVRDDQFFVLDDIRALSQRLLERFLSAMHIAAPRSDIGITLARSSNQAIITLSAVSQSGEALRYTSSAPILK